MGSYARAHGVQKPFFRRTQCDPERPRSVQMEGVGPRLGPPIGSANNPYGTAKHHVGHAGRLSAMQDSIRGPQVNPSNSKVSAADFMNIVEDLKFSGALSGDDSHHSTTGGERDY